MRVLIAIHQFDDPSAGGTEVYTAALARELASRHDVAVLYPSRSANARAEGLEIERDADGVVHYRIGESEWEPRTFEEWYEASGRRFLFVQALRHFAPDAVHVQHLSGLGLSFLVEAKAHAPVVVMTLADYWLSCPRGQMIRDDLSNCERPEVERCSACLFGAPAIRDLENRARAMGGPLGALLPESGRVGAALRLAGARALARVGAGLSNVAEANARVERRLSLILQVDRLVDRFIAPSEAIGTRHRRLGLPGWKIAHLDYGFEALPGIERVPRAEDEPFRLGFIGTLIPSKGAHLIGEALARLPDGTARAHLWGALVPYHGDESYARTLERAFQGTDHERHGPLPHGRIAEALSQIDALVVPSLWRENSPLVIHEAMQAGVPVIAADAGGMPELVRHGETGLLFRTGDAVDLARQIKLLAGGAVELANPRAWSFAVDPIADHARRVERLYRGEPV